MFLYPERGCDRGVVRGDAVVRLSDWDVGLVDVVECLEVAGIEADVKSVDPAENVVVPFRVKRPSFPSEVALV